MQRMIDRESSPCSLIWRRTRDNLSFERATLNRTAGGYKLEGTILAAHAAMPLHVEYTIETDPPWNTTACVVDRLYGNAHKHLALRVNEGRWLVNEEHRRDLDGCVDVYMEISPSTNMLPINRLNLDFNRPEAMSAAWVRFPELDVARSSQSYERNSAGCYLYRNRASCSEAQLQVDPVGLVIDYADIWERVA